MGMALAKLRLFIALPVLSTLAMATASNGQDYSFEEQEACTSDAFRLCSELIPDIPRITACLQAKRDQLSPRCAKMFVPNRDRHLNDPNQRPRDTAPRNQQPHEQVQPPGTPAQGIPAQRRDFDDPPADKPFD